MGRINVSMNAASVVALGSSGDFDPIDSHTEWVEGRVHQTGFTTTLPPNMRVPYVLGSQTYDIDYTSAEENATTTTFAAVTSRSYHAGVVHVLLMDGSVRPVSSSINLTVWRGLGTRAGREVVSDY